MKKFVGMSARAKNNEEGRRIVIQLNSKEKTIKMESNGNGSSFLLEEMCNIMDEMISEWYRGLSYEVKVKCQCIECNPLPPSQASFLSMRRLQSLLSRGKTEVTCNNTNTITIFEILHETKLVLEKPYHLLPNDVKCDRSLGSPGSYGQVYRGHLYNSTIQNEEKMVAIKKFLKTSDEQTLLKESVVMR